MLDSDIQEELRKRFNPEGSDLRILQKRLLQILKFIDRICTENGISYWLSSGTCLGAVRHGGFIPWDDDVDVEMFEEDYKKFCDIMYHQNNSNYVLQTHKTDANYHMAFGKIRDLNSYIEEDSGFDKKYKFRGCFVDVFPIAPSNSNILFIIGRFLNIKLLNADHYNQKIRRIMWLGAYKIITPILRFVTKLGSHKTYRHRVGSLFHKKRLYSDICETVQISFEGHDFPIPRNYDSYLSELYGDYMKLPPIDKIQIHASNFKIF